jgi:micrococcal nuclease
MPHRFVISRALSLLLALCMLAALLAAPAAWGNEQPYGVVVRCFDGDTVRLQDGRVVRLTGIDTPEVRHGDSPAQYYAAEAKALLERLVLQKTVRLRAVGEERDHYQRVLAVLELEDGTNVNRRMLEEGAAFAYRHKKHPAHFTDDMLQAQREALQAQRGFWQKILALPAATESYVGNKNSWRFFPAHSKEGQRIKAKNQQALQGLAQAFTQGFSPARVTSFWPTLPH